MLKSTQTINKRHKMAYHQYLHFIILGYFSENLVQSLLIIINNQFNFLLSQEVVLRDSLHS